MNLHQPAPRTARRIAGLALITGLLATSAWAAQTPENLPALTGNGSYEVSLNFYDQFGPGSSTARLQAGEPFEVSHGEGDAKLSYRFTLSADGKDAAKMQLIARHGAAALTTPEVGVKLGETGTILAKDDKKGIDLLVRVTVTSATAPDISK